MLVIFGDLISGPFCEYMVTYLEKKVTKYAYVLLSNPPPPPRGQILIPS
jgi:hypothetical protein